MQGSRWEGHSSPVARNGPFSISKAQRSTKQQLAMVRCSVRSHLYVAAQAHGLQPPPETYRRHARPRPGASSKMASLPVHLSRLTSHVHARELEVLQRGCVRGSGCSAAAAMAAAAPCHWQSVATRMQARQRGKAWRRGACASAPAWQSVATRMKPAPVRQRPARAPRQRPAHAPAPSWRPSRPAGSRPPHKKFCDG